MERHEKGSCKRVMLLRYKVSPEIGGGHMARCLAIASEFELRGFDTWHMVDSDQTQFLPAGHSVRAITWPEDADAPIWTSPLEGSAKAELALIDHYGPTAAEEKWLGSIAERVAAIDDLADRTRFAGIVINSAPLLTASRYAGLISKDSQTLLGSDFAILRREFRRTRLRRSADGSLSRNRTASKNVLVSFGSSDPSNATLLVLDAIDGLAEVGAITVVLSRLAPHYAVVAERAAQMLSPTTLLHGSDRMAELSAEHAVAVGAPGLSALERACLGIPQILIETALNQADQSLGLARAGAARVLGLQEGTSKACIREAVQQLLTDETAAAEMARNGSMIVDGLGAPRIAALLSARPQDRQGRALSARALHPADSEVLFNWQKNPETRRYSRSSASPTWAEHERFIARHLAKQSVFEIITRESEPVALVRADPTASGLEVSIVVAPSARGDGIGRAALAYLDALLPSDLLIAFVDPANTASLSMFRHAGYSEQCEHRRLVIQRMQQETS